VKSLVLSRTRPRTTTSRPRSLSRLSWSRPASEASHLEFAESKDHQEVVGPTRGRVRYRQTEYQGVGVDQRRSLSVLSSRSGTENQLLPCTLSTAKFSQTPEPKQVTFVPVKQKLPQQSVVHLRSLQPLEHHDESKKLPTKRYKNHHKTRWCLSIMYRH